MEKRKVKNFFKMFITLLILLLGNTIGVKAGQNASAGIRIDLNSSTSGNQNQTSISCPGTDTYIRVDIYVTGASNLDTYEFDLNFNASELEFIGGAEDQPITYETNFLKKNGGATQGWACSAAGGVVNCTNSLVGDQGEDTPDGGGLLASIVFKCLVDCPDGLSFGTVDWYDNGNDHDVCSDKGDASLPVQMTNMTATATQNGVVLNWYTATEVNCTGFHIWRSKNKVYLYKKITTELIPSKGNNSTGYEYTYKDKSAGKGVMYWYKIEEMATNGSSRYYGPVAVMSSSSLPAEFKLSQNYPNPFNPNTNIIYQLPYGCKVSIKIYNLLGEEIIELVNNYQPAGYYNISWNGKNKNNKEVSNGIYLIYLDAGTFQAINKATVLR